MPTQPSARERLVAELIAQGQSNRQIAAALHISHDTARRYSSQVRRKWDLANVAALACAGLPTDPARLQTIVPVSAILSPAEIGVLALLCQGLGTKHIARARGLSPRTVDKHRQHLLRKTGTHSVRALTAWVAQQYALCGIAARAPSV